MRHKYSQSSHAATVGSVSLLRCNKDAELEGELTEPEQKEARPVTPAEAVDTLAVFH